MMDELKAFPLFQDVPDTEIRWFLERSQIEDLQAGEFFLQENTPSTRFYIVIEGELQVTRTVNGRETVLGTNPPGVVRGALAVL